MPRIVSVGTALPEHIYYQEDVKNRVKDLFSKKFHGTERMLSIFTNSNIKKRHFSVPMEWFAGEHTFAEKNKLYITNARDLGAEAIINCLRNTDFSLSELDNIIFVSSTGIATPSIDALIINKLHLKKHIKRTPIWGLGCAGGVVGITRAYEYAKAYPGSLVIAVTVELCGITFQQNDFTKSNFIATALFGEGAAAVLIAGDEVALKGEELRPHILDTMSSIWENTLEIMGWEVDDSGLQVIFSKDIPTFVRKYMRSNVEEYLHSKGLTLADIKHFIIHPGGTKVIEAYQEALSLPEGAAKHEQEVIRDFGNMSSPTVLFVMQRKLKDKIEKGDYGIITALGPGFSSELILVQWQ